MYPSNGTGTYQQVSVFTAEPLKLVIMCYDETISCLRLAKQHYENRAYEAKGSILQKALNIIGELEASLDLNRGGEVAVNLKHLYQYMTRRLIEGDLMKDLRAFDEVICMLEELASAWRGIAQGTKRQADILPQRYEQDARRSALAGFGWRG